jgi:hypothetical protein
MIWTLIPVSVIYGLVAALVLRRFSDRAAVRASMNRMIAHVMEFRLFLGTPSLVLRSQRDLLLENLRLLRLILLPSIMLAILFLALFPQLDALYGHAPLRPGEPSVVSARIDGNATLEVPPGINIETPPVHSLHDRQISWRVRPMGTTAGELRVSQGGRILRRRIVAGKGFIDGYISRGIDIRYPRRSVLGAHWLVWFFLISAVAALGYCPGIEWTK